MPTFNRLLFEQDWDHPLELSAPGEVGEENKNKTTKLDKIYCLSVPKYFCGGQNTKSFVDADLIPNHCNLPNVNWLQSREW